MGEEFSRRMSRTITAWNGTSGSEKRCERKYHSSILSNHDPRHPAALPKRFGFLAVAGLALRFGCPRTSGQAAVGGVVTGGMSGTVTARRRTLELLRVRVVLSVGARKSRQAGTKPVSLVRPGVLVSVCMCPLSCARATHPSFSSLSCDGMCDGGGIA